MYLFDIIVFEVLVNKVIFIIKKFCLIFENALIEIFVIIENALINLNLSLQNS